MGLFGKKKETHAPPAVPVIPVAPVSHVPSFDEKEFSLKARMAAARGDVMKKKSEAQLSASRRAIEKEIRPPANNPAAFIRGEQYLRERRLHASYDTVILFLEMLRNRSRAIAGCPNFEALPSDLKEAVSSIVFASNRTNIDETTELVQMLRGLYTAEVIDPISNCEGPNSVYVNKLLLSQLQGSSVDRVEVRTCLTQVAAEAEISYFPPAEIGSMDSYGGGSGGGYGGGYGGGGGGGAPVPFMPGGEAAAQAFGNFPPTAAPGGAEPVLFNPTKHGQ